MIGTDEVVKSAMEAFEPLVIALYGLGALMSLLFVLTWYPMAFAALAHHRKDVSLLRILDYAGLHLFVAISFSIVLRTLFLYGLQPPQDAVAAFGRLFLPLGIDVIVALRLYKWGTRLWEHRRDGQAGGELLSGVSKGSWRPEDPVEDAMLGPSDTPR